VRSGHVRPTPITRVSLLSSVLIIAATAWFLTDRYDRLPDILPVRFGQGGFPIGWQYKTPGRVLMPALVQSALSAMLAAVGWLLLSRPHGDHELDAPDVRTAAAAAEAVALIGIIWVAFQGYAAVALAGMWQRGRGGLGALYTLLEITGVVLSVVVFARAHVSFGRPGPRPFVAEHWAFGQLYRNRQDPALFVPTRDGRRWTLNFGRPVAVVLMGVILGAGVVAPAVLLGLMLR
jgi:uncharacterized membrane protein